MSGVSADQSINARNLSRPAYNLPHVVMQRLAAKKNSTVATAMGRDDSYISRVTSGELGIKLEDLHRFLDALDLKVVDKGHVCVEREVYLFYKTLAMKYMGLQQAEAVLEDWDE